MIVLDENIQHDQWAALRSGRVRARRIGHEVGRAGLQDEEIIPFLLTLRRPTFFTRDADFYRPRLRHRGYCLVYLAIAPHEVARYVRRFLRHPALATQAARLGIVARASEAGITVWRLRAVREEDLPWP